MWSLKWQSILRKLILGLLILGILGFSIYWAAKGSFNLSSGELKLRYTWYLLRVETLGTQFHVGAFAGMTLLFLLGFPSIFGIVVGVFLWGNYAGFAGVMAAQMIASGLLMLKMRPSPSGLKKLEPELMEMISKNEPSPAMLALYPRLFISFPLRTVDQMVSFACGTRGGIFAAYILSGLGIGIRLLVQGVWFVSLVNLILDFRPYPEADLAWFLVASALILFSYIWPTMPELLPGNREIGKMFLVLAGEESLTPSSNPPKSPLQKA